MQVYTKYNWAAIKTLFFFVAVLFLAFLPVSSFLFFLKNDAFTGYFPPKFFMSESLSDGYLPLWNPYINFGFPQYGDMSGGYWSPITWLMASTVGYNAYSFTIEIFFYLLLAGSGMYKLSGFWQLDKKVRLIAGIVFMCCGYHVGHLQHFNWLSGSAFLPWCCWSYLSMLKYPSFKFVLLNVLSFYLLLSSAHPGIIIGAAYFFVAVAFFYLVTTFKKNGLKKIAFTHAALFIILGIVCAGMIVGYADIIPHFVRGEKNSFAIGVSDATSLQSWISLLLPMSVVKNESWFQSDLSLRDSYMSLILLLFLFMSFFSKKTTWQKFFIGVGMFFFLLSLGGVFQNIISKVLPLTGYVRLHGEFRIFSIFSFIITGVIELDKYLKGEKKFEGIARWFCYSLMTVTAVLFVWSVAQAVSNRDSFLYDMPQISSQASLTSSLKSFIDHISFYDCVWIHSIIQLIILKLATRFLKTKNSTLLLKLVVADMIMATLLVVPFTGAGKASVKMVQQVLDGSPRGIPIPPLHAIINNDSLASPQNEMIGSWSMFNKQIGTVKEVPYPIQLKSMKAFFRDANKVNSSLYFNKPFIFTRNNLMNDSISIISFTPNTFRIYANSSADNNQLVIQQNRYPYWHCSVNGKEVMVAPDGISFMHIPIQKGQNDIILSFRPSLIKTAMLVSAIAFVSILILLSVMGWKAKYSYPSSPKQ